MQRGIPQKAERRPKKEGLEPNGDIRHLKTLLTLVDYARPPLVTAIIIAQSPSAQERVRTQGGPLFLFVADDANDGDVASPGAMN